MEIQTTEDALSFGFRIRTQRKKKMRRREKDEGKKASTDFMDEKNSRRYANYIYLESTRGRVNQQSKAKKAYWQKTKLYKINANIFFRTRKVGVCEK